MPQRLCNTPNTHQQHRRGAREQLPRRLPALRNTKLCCSRKKTNHFTTRIKFLWHIITRNGLRADPDKTDEIKNWLPSCTAPSI
ncbi:hypothetical protein B0A53_03638 [Rhodotorula sp. CCFEE 5036]|nr:hypothetical protein B0A53_03638 [Rhodotorula sp. CCFEE 5036]